MGTDALLVDDISSLLSGLITLYVHYCDLKAEHNAFM